MTEENTRKHDYTKQAQNVVRELDQAFLCFGLVISAKYTWLSATTIALVLLLFLPFYKD